MDNIQCHYCGAFVNLGRQSLGYRTCLNCGDIDAKKIKHTIVPMHKSNYMLVTDKTLLRQLNKRSA